MREKFIDAALVIGLVVVCAIIVVTLFFPSSRGNRQAATTATPPLEPTAATPAEAAADNADVPLIASSGEPDPTTEAETAAAEAPVGAETAAGAETAPATEAATETPTTEATPTTSETTPLQPLPEGAFDLERVGFSFAGVTGACSVVLEPWRHIAVSRDILARYPCGSEVTLALDEPVAGRSSFTAVVGDTMNPSNVRTVNIYVAPDEPALEYGVAAGRLSP